MCLHPRLLKNPRYKENKKNGGNIPAVHDNRALLIPVACGECKECMKQKALQWKVRLMEECRETKHGNFITLTFSTESLRELTTECLNRNSKLKGYTLDNAICTLAVRRFLERWRKKYKTSVRHWLITEIGGSHSEHVHMHGVIWTENREEIDRIWGYGFTWGSKNQTYVNEKTVNYISKYVTKKDSKHKNYKPIVLCSKGIGAGYLKRADSIRNKFNEEKTIETYTTRTGHKINLPTYYRNKLYSDEEKEMLWMHKLDKQERWVLGEKIDVSNGQTEYMEALKYAQVINRELGYGGVIDWEKKKYEEELRVLKQMERLNNNNNKKKKKKK